MAHFALLKHPKLISSKIYEIEKSLDSGSSDFFFVKLIYISCLFTISGSFYETSRTDGTEIGTEIGTETGTEIVEVQETIDLAGKKLRAEAVCITGPILEILGKLDSV